MCIVHFIESGLMEHYSRSNEIWCVYFLCVCFTITTTTAYMLNERAHCTIVIFLFIHICCYYYYFDLAAYMNLIDGHTLLCTHEQKLRLGMKWKKKITNEKQCLSEEKSSATNIWMWRWRVLLLWLNLFFIHLATRLSYRFFSAFNLDGFFLSFKLWSEKKTLLNSVLEEKGKKWQ